MNISFEKKLYGGFLQSDINQNKKWVGFHVFYLRLGYIAHRVAPHRLGIQKTMTLTGQGFSVLSSHGFYIKFVSYLHLFSIYV